MSPNFKFLEITLLRSNAVDVMGYIFLSWLNNN